MATAEDELQDLAAPPQEFLRNDLDGTLVNGVVVLLCVLLVHDIVARNWTPDANAPAIARIVFSWRLLSAEATTALIAGLLAVKYATRQIALSYRPYLTFSTTLGPLAVLAKARGIRTTLTNAGTGASGPTRLDFTIKLKDRAERQFTLHEHVIAELKAAGFSEEVDFYLSRTGTAGGLVPGATIRFFECNEKVMDAIETFEMVVTFQGLFGGLYKKEVYFYPRRWKTFGRPPFLEA